MSKKEEGVVNPKYYGNKDIGISLNNAYLAAWGSVNLKNTTDIRKQALRAYLSAILDAILAHRREGHMTAEELVAVFASAAMFCHVNLVVGGGVGKLQAYADLAENLAADQEQLSNPLKKKGKK